MLYLEERQHQILPEEHQPEIHSLRFFGSGAEGAAIEVLALINWAAEFVEISRSPVPEISSHAESEFQRPFQNHLGLHCSIYFLDSVPPLLRRVRQGVIPDGAWPNCRSTEPTGSCGRRKMGKVPQGGSARDRGPELFYSVLGQRSIQAPPGIQTAGGSASDRSRQCASRVHPH